MDFHAEHDPAAAIWNVPGFAEDRCPCALATVAKRSNPAAVIDSIFMTDAFAWMDFRYSI